MQFTAAAAAVPASASGGEGKVKAGEYQHLTENHSEMLVGSEERREGLATCDPSGRRFSSADTVASARSGETSGRTRVSTDTRVSRRTQGRL